MLPPIIPEFIQKAINKQIEDAINEELKLVSERIEKRKAEIIAGVILYVQQTLIVDRITNGITITIKDERK